jgi:adenylate kinase
VRINTQPPDTDPSLMEVGLEQHRRSQLDQVGLAPRVLLVGRPGAGKGTQGARLADRLGVPYLSTGDLLRSEIAAGSPLGREVDSVVNAGELIPTAVIIAIVEAVLTGDGLDGDRLSDDCPDGDGYVLDGFPRTVEQAVALTSHPGLEPHIAIEIVVPPATALARLVDRGRVDDGISVARRRLAVYEAETVPMLAYLTGHRLLFDVNGQQDADLVADDVWNVCTQNDELQDWLTRSVESAA